MNRENILAAGFHSAEAHRHWSVYFETVNKPALQVTSNESLSLQERFEQMRSMLEPLLISLELYDHDWYATPEVPLTGKVERKNVEVYLSIQVQKNKETDYSMISPQVRTSNEERPSGIRGMHVSRGGANAQYDKEEGEDENLDHVEEAVGVYFKALASLSPRELRELGFSFDFVPQNVQLSFEDLANSTA